MRRMKLVLCSLALVAGFAFCTPQDTLAKKKSEKTDVLSSVEIATDSSTDASTEDKTTEATTAEPTTEATTEKPKSQTFKYRVKAGDSFTKYSKTGKIAGDEKGASLTAIDMYMASPLDGELMFATYTDANGWTEYGNHSTYMADGEEISAIKMYLTEELKKKYDIYYCVHITNGGWLDWTKNGVIAGTKDLGQKINAIKVSLVESGKKSKAPGATTTASLTADKITYRACRKNKTFMGYVKSGKTAGKDNVAITAVTMKLSDDRVDGKISYRLAKENAEFGDWVSMGNDAGKAKDSTKYSKMQIKVEGALADVYDIYYRVKIEKYGWQGWAKNGETAGHDGLEYAIVAYQAKFMRKNSDKSSKLKTAHAYIKSNQETYVIKVNKTLNCVTLYLDKKPIKAFVCSAGKATPTGTFYTPYKGRWQHMIHDVWAQWATQISGNYLFHSVPYNEPNNRALRTSSYNKLGSTASAGCVRLCAHDAKWIYDNCKLKTKVIIYTNSKTPGPLGKPKPIRIPGNQTWDPTDPTVTKKK